MRRDGVVVNTLAPRPRGPGFNSWSDRTLPSRSSFGQAVNSQLPWWGYEAVHEGCDHLVRVYYVYNPDCTVVHVRHLRLFLRLFVRPNCGVSVVLLKEIFILFILGKLA